MRQLHLWALTNVKYRNISIEQNKNVSKLSVLIHVDWIVAVRAHQSIACKATFLYVFQVIKDFEDNSYRFLNIDYVFLKHFSEYLSCVVYAHEHRGRTNILNHTITQSFLLLSKIIAEIIHFFMLVCPLSL